MKYLTLTISFSLLVYSNCYYHHHHQGDDQPVEVSTSLGKIKGRVNSTRLGNTFYSFRGIRYAEPPVGQQRFKSPKPVKPWSDVFDATKEGPACPQPGNITISEDCLRLNVYTPQLPSDKSSAAKPVLVFFHPGGYYVFSGRSDFLGPEYLLDQDIVLVTGNYRLGALGFLSTGDSLAPGNNGLKDQVEVLRWVQNNIAAFGGDPNDVTLGGYSAGARSTGLHLVSPMSKGLFHKAIAMSASNANQNPYPPHQKHLAIKQAELLDCPTDSTGSMLICLNTKPVGDFVKTLGKFFEWHGDPILVWSPVIEPEVRGEEQFLTAQPIDLIKQGKFHHVPFIAGVTKNEFGGVVVRRVEAARKGDISTFQDLNVNWTRIAPISYAYERNTSRSLAISEALRQYYLKGEPASLSNVEGQANLYADGVVIFGVHRMVQLLGRYSTQPVYYYKFSYQGRYSWATWSDKKPYGVNHHDDLLYLFNFFLARFPRFEKDAPEISTVERMTSLWGNFVKTGNPTPPGNQDKLSNCTWEHFTPENQSYLEIGDELTMKSGLYTERMKVWEKFFPV